MSGLLGFNKDGVYSAPASTLKWFALVLVAIVELLIVSFRFDSGVLTNRAGVLQAFAEKLPLIPQFAAVILTATLVFGSRELTTGLTRVARHVRPTYAEPVAFLFHLVIFCLFVGFSTYFFEINRGESSYAFLGWLVLAFLTAASWVTVMVPPSSWQSVGKELAWPSLIGACVGGSAWLAGQWANEAWSLLANTTFQLVWFMLAVLGIDVSRDPATLTIGTSEFAVRIVAECSGYEGMGLAVVFISTYLWWKREDHIFPRSLLLIPASVLLMFFVNAIRIALLVLIGHVGAKEVAAGGFHSQAGWIGFNLVALGVVAFARTSPFFCASRTRLAQTTDFDPVEQRAIPLLAPFVVLMFSIMLTGIVQTGFDWLYPIRLLAVAMTIVLLLASCPKGLWETTLNWQALTIGVGVYLIWFLLEKGDAGVAKSAYDLAQTNSPWLFNAWLVFRVIGSATIVPIAEEFAFRGYLLSWLAGEQEKRWSWFALFVSSFAFGALHPGRWIAATIAGALYGLVYYRRKRVMDAVLAHAITNALIALEAVIFSRWYLWG